jgi:L-threonylcarbamoyladenylate synthase
MQTTNWRLGSGDAADRRAIEEAAAWLREGKTVAFPTETVYGLGADAASDEAVRRIFAAKGRPSDNPLIVHVAGVADAERLAMRISPMAARLMERFWPGPLTVVLPCRHDRVAPSVTAGLATVAVRVPAHPVALALMEAAQIPVAAPSANLSGRPSPTTAAHVREDLDGRIDGILDGGPAGIGLESTVVEADDNGRVTVLRPGGISLEQLREVAPDAALDEALLQNAAAADFAPKSPGMKYAHYAPRGAMVVVAGDSAERVVERMRRELAAAAERGAKTGVLAFSEHLPRLDADVAIAYGSLRNPDEAASRLYGALREFDEHGVEVIVAEGWTESGIGLAVMNRLGKAASGRILRV